MLEDSLSKKTSKKSFLIIAAVVLLIIALVVGFFVYQKMKGRAPSAADKTAQFVTASPLDMDQISTISKFRSCAGHDYSGKNVDGVVETERSMKNYATPKKSLENTTNQVKIFSPFDATVISNEAGKLGDNLDLTPTAAPGWVYELGHIASVKKFAKGNSLKAGELVGYYNEGGAFDLQFWFGDESTVNTLHGYFDSLFAHMTPELAEKLKPFGLTADSLIVSKSYRDAHPCKGATKDMGSTIFEGNMAEDVVTLTHSGSSDEPTTPTSSECAATIPVAQRPPGCGQ